MWTEIFLTQDNSIVDYLCAEIKKKKIITKIKKDFGNIKVLVPFAEVNETLDLIIDLDI